jgi:hypothetical protein
MTNSCGSDAGERADSLLPAWSLSQAVAVPRVATFTDPSVRSVGCLPLSSAVL